MHTEDYNRVIGKATEKLRKDTSFVRRNYPVFWIALLLYILCTVFSGAAIFAHVNIRATEIFAPLWAGILTGVITVIILGAQFMFKFVVDDWQARVVTKGGADFAMMLFKAALGTVGMIFAVTLSYNGAAKITDYVRKEEQSENVALISTDSIRAYYDARIAGIDESVKEQEGTKWQKSITSQANKNLSVLYNNIAALESEKLAALKDAQKRNDVTIAEYKSGTVENKSYAKGFAGIAELLALICIVLIGIFDDGLKKEAKSLGVRAEKEQETF
jgi:hypothetical protein